MRFRSDKSPLDRRLHQVAQDSAELRAEIKRLQRALKNPERLLTRQEFVPPPPRVVRPPTPGEQPAEPPAPPPPAPAAPAGGEPFTWNPATASAPPPVVSRKPAPDDQRFAHYFSSTGFLGKPALRQERSVLRNRAIFVTVIVIILGGIVFKLIFR